MASVLRLGNRKIDSTELISLLTQYQLLPQLLREWRIDSAIAQVALTEEEQTIAEEAFNTRHQITDEDSRQTWMKQQGLTSEQFEQLIPRPWRIEKFK